MKIVRNWSVMEKKGAIVVKGTGDDGLHWTTSAVTKRNHRFEVQTLSGSIYRLVGEHCSTGGITILHKT